jgi:hypothetical protein
MHNWGDFGQKMAEMRQNRAIFPQNEPKMTKSSAGTGWGLTLADPF